MLISYHITMYCVLLIKHIEIDAPAHSVFFLKYNVNFSILV